MGFQFYSGNFDLPIINRRFVDFQKDLDRLPFCFVRFLPRVAGLKNGKTLVCKEGALSFYVYDGGIMLTNATTYSLMPDSFDEMALYLPSQNKIIPQELTHLMLLSYRYILVHAGHFQIHSAVVVKNGVGIAFCGSPGAGKSTQAHLWEEHVGAEALNLDQPVILYEDDKVLVSGSPWSGKEDCYKTDIVPLAAIFYVVQSPYNAVTPMSPGVAFANLFAHNYLPPVTDTFRTQFERAVARLATSVPVYRLDCTISREAVDVAYRTVFGD